MSSYDVSSNPTVAEGEIIQSVKTNSHTLVEEWWNSSSGTQQLIVVNEWSAGLKPTVVRVEDEWLDNDNQDDGAGSDKEMSEVGGGEWSKGIEQCDGDDPNPSDTLFWLIWEINFCDLKFEGFHVFQLSIFIAREASA